MKKLQLINSSKAIVEHLVEELRVYTLLALSYVKEFIAIILLPLYLDYFIEYLKSDPYVINTSELPKFPSEVFKMWVQDSVRAVYKRFTKSN